MDVVSTVTYPTKKITTVYVVVAVLVSTSNYHDSYFTVLHFSNVIVISYPSYKIANVFVVENNCFVVSYDTNLNHHVSYVIHWFVCNPYAVENIVFVSIYHTFAITDSVTVRDFPID